MEIWSALSGGNTAKKGPFEKVPLERKKTCELQQLQYQHCPWRSPVFNPSECWIRGFSILYSVTQLPTKVWPFVFYYVCPWSPPLCPARYTALLPQQQTERKTQTSGAPAGDEWAALLRMCSLNPPPGIQCKQRWTLKQGIVLYRLNELTEQSLQRCYRDTLCHNLYILAGHKQVPSETCLLQTQSVSHCFNTGNYVTLAVLSSNSESKHSFTTTHKWLILDWTINMQCHICMCSIFPEVFIDSSMSEVLACAPLKSRELDQCHLIEHFLSLDELEGLPICLYGWRISLTCQRD